MTPVDRCINPKRGEVGISAIIDASDDETERPRNAVTLQCFMVYVTGYSVKDFSYVEENPNVARPFPHSYNLLATDSCVTALTLAEM